MAGSQMTGNVVVLIGVARLHHLRGHGTRERGVAPPGMGRGWGIQGMGEKLQAGLTPTATELGLPENSRVSWSAA